MAKYLVDIDLNYNQLKSALAEKIIIDANGFYRHIAFEPPITPMVGQVAFDLTDNRLKYCYSFDGNRYTWKSTDSQGEVNDIIGHPDDSPSALTLYGLSNRSTNIESSIAEINSSIADLASDVSEIKDELEVINSKIDGLGLPYATIEYSGNDINIIYNPSLNQSTLDFTCNELYMRSADLYVDDLEMTTTKRMYYVNEESKATFTWNGNLISRDRVKLRVSGKVKRFGS